MKVLVFAHRLEIGGTQTNAVELAETLRDRHGHEVVLFATPGPAAALARDRGLKLMPAPDARRHPSRARIGALRDIISAEDPDVIHVWDWPQCLDAWFGSFLDLRVPLVCTAMGMTVPRLLPRIVPVTYGTPALHAEALGRRPHNSHLLEPPVDLTRNRPGVVDGRSFRRRFHIADDELAVVAVSRLTEWMKLEGLVRLAGVAGTLAVDHPVRLVVVGEGPSAPVLAERAADVNERAGREIVTLTGPLIDPRPAYEAADIVAGMGGSALRAMAFAKPLLVLGERGFSRVFDRASAEWFIWNGTYGLGDGDDGAATRALTAQLRRLLSSGDERADVAACGHDVVRLRYGLDAAAHQVDLLLHVAAERRPGHAAVLADSVRMAGLRWGRACIPDRVHAVVMRGAQRVRVA